MQYFYDTLPRSMNLSLLPAPCSILILLPRFCSGRWARDPAPDAPEVPTSPGSPPEYNLSMYTQNTSILSYPGVSTRCIVSRKRAFVDRYTLKPSP